jgi:peptidyl-prolyl cis-trans isomerase SurA
MPRLLFRLPSRILLSLAALVAVALAAAPASAQTSIVAVVNGEPITSYDVAQRQQLLRLTNAGGNLRDQALEELIDEKVQLKAATQARVTVSEADVDEAIAGIASRVRLSPAQLGQALAQGGVNIATLRERIKTQIAFNRLVRQQFRAGGGVTEQDLVAALLKDKEAPRQVDAAIYELMEVTIPLPPKPTPADMSRAESRAADLRARFTSCSEGEAMVKKTMNVVIRPYGKRMDVELPGDAREAVKDVAVGRLSGPILGARGLVMLAVCDKTMVKSTNAAMKALETDLATEKAEQFTKQYTRQLRRDAVIERM